MDSDKIFIKTEEEVKIMEEGGKKLSNVKKTLKEAVKIGVNAAKIESLAVELIKKEGAKPSFMMVPGYSWATCINVNEGLVHGIPKKTIVFKKGDVVSVDVGLFFKGYHSDTSFSLGLDVEKPVDKFLKVGEEAFGRAVKAARPGNYIYHISEAMEEVLVKNGYSPIKALVGHGVGRYLHEEPKIPCFVPGRIQDSPKIETGMVLAIEVMYAMGSPSVYQEEDGWTIAMRDGKISALFEDTVAVGVKGAKVLTR